jgi:hypothetical protein
MLLRYSGVEVETSDPGFALGKRIFV